MDLYFVRSNRGRMAESSLIKIKERMWVISIQLLRKGQRFYKKYL